MPPKPFDPDLEASFAAVLARMKAREDAENGPGAFEHSVARGTLMMQKRADELTAGEAAFIDSPPPAKRQS